MDGLLVLDKPAGLTSHDVVARVRRRLPRARVGHGGTLDPLATGVLLILVGRATKSAGALLSLDKAYEAIVTLGLTTDTHDIEGAVLTHQAVPVFSLAQVNAACERFRGDIEQVVPAYSAVHFAGRRGYELARAGLAVPEKRRRVQIAALTVEEVIEGHLLIRVTCSKGTYIRTLAHDIGTALGCGGMLSALRRTRVGPWPVEDAYPLSAVESMSAARIAELVQPVRW